MSIILFKHECYNLLIRPQVWLLGLLETFLKFFVLTLLCQPVTTIQAYQWLGFLWLLFWLAQIQAVHQGYQVDTMGHGYEQACLSVWSDGQLWRMALWALCLVQGLSACVWGSICGFLLGLAWDQLGLFMMLWYVQMPVYVLMAYVTRLLSLQSLGALCLAVLLMLPWSLPSALWTAETIVAYQNGLNFTPYVCMILAWTLLGLWCLPMVIDQLRHLVYLRLRLYKV